MAKIVLHRHTQHDFQQLIKQLPHALGLVGERGVGLLSAATYLANGAKATVETLYPEKDEKINQEAGRITIDIIRRLRSSTRVKSTVQRCVIITAADTMTHEAQNAFLKLLEEPGENLSFILLIHQQDRLLPTVRSRLQLCTVHPVTAKQSELLLDRLNVTDGKKRQQLLFLASGRPAALTRLVENTTLFESEAAALRQARTFVQGSIYQQLMVCHALKNSRADAQRLVFYAMNIMKHDIHTKKSIDEKKLSHLVKLEQAAIRLKANGNPRLVLAEVALMR